MTLKEKFQNVAVREYNKKNKTKYDTFAELQLSLANGTDVLCEDQYFGIIRIEKSIPSFCEWIIAPSALDKKNSSDEEKAKLKKTRSGKDLCIKYRLKSESLKTKNLIFKNENQKNLIFKNKDFVQGCSKKDKKMKGAVAPFCCGLDICVFLVKLDDFI